jgi:hypothetical protein
MLLLLLLVLLHLAACILAVTTPARAGVPLRTIGKLKFDSQVLFAARCAHVVHLSCYRHA